MFFVVQQGRAAENMEYGGEAGKIQQKKGIHCPLYKSLTFHHLRAVEAK